MRKFIISDIHGLGNVYHSIIHYLDNINEEEPIELYINGDLIDRGLESAQIFLDIKKRMQENNYKIVYLGGNHELMMDEVFEKRRKGIAVSPFNDWYDNGGFITDDGLYDELQDEDKMLEAVSFVSDLKIYHKFNEKIKDKNIVLVHASCPMDIKDECDLTLKQGDDIFYYVWAREDDPFIPFRCRIGHKDYFTIVGHTPNISDYGFEYHKKENYLNIDGGCAQFARGMFANDHVPLVEIKNGYLKILTFNNSNEIIYGNYFDGENTIPLTEEELERERNYLNRDLKVKKLVRLPDNIIGYEDWIK